MSERFLTPQEAAQIANIPVSWIYDKTRRDALPGIMVRIGKYVRLKESAWERFLEAGGTGKDV